MKLHHFGIVVQDIQRSLNEIAPLLKFDEIGQTMQIGSQMVNICFIKMGETYLELIEPAEKDSPVSNFLSFEGGGFHHLCFEVDDIHLEIKRLENSGAKIVVEPMIGFENRLIAFLNLNMKETNCNLIELAQSKPS